MRSLLTLAVGLVACAPAPAAPKPDPTGTCYDGQILSGEVIACPNGRACVLASGKPSCVEAAVATAKEPCGTISCGEGCACSGDTPNECVCMQLGPSP